MATKRRFGPLQCPARVSDAANTAFPLRWVGGRCDGRPGIREHAGSGADEALCRDGAILLWEFGVRRGPTGRIGVSCVDCWEGVPALDARPEQVDVPLTVVWLARCGAPGFKAVFRSVP